MFDSTAKRFDPRIIISLMLPRPLRYLDLSQSGECIGEIQDLPRLLAEAQWRQSQPT